MNTPLSEPELVALRWLSNHLNVLSCGNCRGQWVVAKSQPILFHRCLTPRRARARVQLPPVKDTTLEDGRRAIWDGFLGAMPGDALLRPLDADEARAETDKGYGGRPGGQEVGP